MLIVTFAESVAPKERDFLERRLKRTLGDDKVERVGETLKSPIRIKLLDAMKTAFLECAWIRTGHVKSEEYGDGQLYLHLGKDCPPTAEV